MQIGHVFAQDANERQRRIQDGRIEILEMIARGAPRDEALAAIARFAEALVPGTVAGVTILDGSRKRFSGAVFPSLTPDFEAAIVGTPAGGHIDADCESWRTLNRAHGIRWMRSQPACASDGTTLGAFVLGFATRRAMDRRDEMLMSTGAYLAGLALEADRQAQQRSLLLGELCHRTNNLMALFGAIARITLSGSVEAIKLRDVLEGRLDALTRAHFLLLERNWIGTNLAELMAQILAPYRTGDRAIIVGEPLVLMPDAALAFALAAHELTTNAAKYGALCSREGRVRVDWGIECGDTGEDRFRFRWTESGGPPVAEPTRRGLGSDVIERHLAQQVGGTTRLVFAPKGVQFLVDAPRAAVLAACDSGETPSRPH